MLCIAAKAQPAGYLTFNGNAIDLPTLARMCGCSAAEVESLIGELERYGVFSRDRKGRIYSRRIVRDAQRSATNQKNGQKGGNPNLCINEQKSESVNPPDKASDKPHIPESIIQKERTDSRSVAVATRPAVDEAFDRFWAKYPRRDGADPKTPAKKKFEAKCRSGSDPEAIISGAERYAAECQRLGKVGTCYVARALTWLNEDRWQDYPSQAPPDDPIKLTHGAEFQDGVYVMAETPEWEAWRRYLKQQGKLAPPTGKSGGWRFPTLLPPGPGPTASGAECLTAE
jgi:hypothetical protein